MKSFFLDGKGMNKYVEEGDVEINEYFIDGKFLNKSFSFRTILHIGKFSSSVGHLGKWNGPIFFSYFSSDNILRPISSLFPPNISFSNKLRPFFNKSLIVLMDIGLLFFNRCPLGIDR